MKPPAIAVLVCAAAVACSSHPADVPPTPPYARLSEWQLFADLRAQIPAGGVVPYEVVSPLFSDYATKFRFVSVPSGAHIGYRDGGVWDLPVGTVLVKTFGYRADVRDEHSSLRLLETRILWHEPRGWSPHSYVWNDAQDDADLSVAPRLIPSDFIGPTGAAIHNDYAPPNTQQCKTCHSTGNTGSNGTVNGVVTPIGLKTRQLDRDHDYGGSVGKLNQIDRLAALGLFAMAPAMKRVALVEPFGAADIGLRVRSYWDGNCAHCHQQGGSASQSSLWLDFHSTDVGQDPANWGKCKAPTSEGDTCGLTYDVVPGDSKDSIMVCRVNSTSPKKHMPALGGNLIHSEGVELIRSWIDGLPLQSCAM